MADDAKRPAAFAVGPDGRGSRAGRDSGDKKSVFSLIGELPGIITTLIRDEIEQIKRELITRLKSAGIGAALFVVAAVFLYFAVFPLMAAVVLGHRPGAALLARRAHPGRGLLIVAVVFVLIGI